ncbi:MAG: glycosyltransferase family 39 protein [Gemmatimonadetes bacterium]|nr:glycosyltransferase family 39 protein [Gemmatimonadota bacterium]
MKLLVALVLLRIGIPLVTLHPAWEFHRDELLYSAMGEHLSLFRMQFPPMIALVSRLGHEVFGTSVYAARVPAALFGGALTGVVLWLVRRVGGGTRALVLAWLALLAAPVFMRTSVLLHPVIIDQLWCAAAVAGVLLALHDESPRWWLLTGTALGLGALTKFSVAFYGLALLVTVLVTPPLRRQLGTRWPWIAALIALTLAIPSLSGQLANDWPFFRSMAALRETQLAGVAATEFLSGQVLMLGAGAIVAAFGVAAAWRNPVARAAAIFACTLLACLLALSGKAYYAAPAWPPLVALGAVALERRVATARAASARATARRLWTWLPPLAVAAGAVILFPLSVPCLAPDAMSRYVIALGEGARSNRGDALSLPQDYADMLGWRAMAAAVGDVVRTLSPDERRDLTIVGSNYGRAGALALYRHAHALPYPVSVHGDFHAWGPGNASGNVMILLDDPDARDDLLRIFRDVREVRRLSNPPAVPEERVVSIFLARGMRQPLADVWKQVGARWD